jgi:hypothetical protein
MMNLLPIMSRLASINGYDDEGRIKDGNGDFMNKTDIAVLLLNAMSPGKIIIGEQEFITLLKTANVNPDLILNENVRSKLLNSSQTKAKSEAYVEPKRTPELAIVKMQPPQPIKEIKEIKQYEHIPEPPRERRVFKRRINIEREPDEFEERVKPLKRRRDELPDNWVVPGED